MEYEKRFAATSQTSQLQEHNLTKETEEILERWKKNTLKATFQKECLGDKPKKQHEDEEGKNII